MKNQFNETSEERHPPPHFIGPKVYEMVKDVHVFLRKWKGTGKNIKKYDMWKKQLVFWELPYWKNLDVHYSLDVMHIKKNACESLLRTMLNLAGKTRDHGHARANLKKM
jgi:hypothetical protein